MKVVIVCKSDSTGGAAVVSRRLMYALRSEGVDARMLVAEKLTNSPYIRTISTPRRIKFAFLADRLPIAFANGFNRRTLFKLDAASAGIDISQHPWVKEADAICLNWINQGVLSLRDIGKLLKSGKRVFWTMHDMWNFTGICHHAGECNRYKMPGRCGDCPLLEKYAKRNDISHRTLVAKEKLYSEKGSDGRGIEFVAVSGWLAERAGESTLLGGSNAARIHIIPNAFLLPRRDELQRVESPGELRLIFGAARLDDDIKCFPVLIEAMRVLKREYPEIARITKLILFGGIKDSSLLNQIEVKMEYAGILTSPEDVRKLYLRSDMVLSTSSYETLPGTLIEGQAYGCYPISFSRGGQKDIIESGLTGRLAVWNDSVEEAGAAIAREIVAGYEDICRDAGIRERMYESVRERFGAKGVARRWIKLMV